MLLSLLSGALVILCSIIAQTVNEQIDPRIRAEQEPCGKRRRSMNDRFQIVGARPLPEAAPTKSRHSLRGKPVASAMILSFIVLGCLFCELIMTKDPTYLDLAHCSTARAANSCSARTRWGATSSR